MLSIFRLGLFFKGLIVHYNKQFCIVNYLFYLDIIETKESENIIMENLNSTIVSKKQRPTKIIQFGEGNFLRAFIDWFIQVIDDETDFNGGVAVVQPLAHGRVKELEKQDGLYTLLLEGIEDGELKRMIRPIDVINECINPYTEYDRYLKLAESEDLKLVISNTTEAGIVYDPNDLNYDETPTSFPGKLLALLKRRYDYFNGSYDAGLYILACELIDYNGSKLKEVMNQLATDKGYSAEFIDWLNNANKYYNTLVDRIVPGYPKDQIEQLTEELDYIDNNIVKGEYFHLWVIEGDPCLTKVFPVDKTNLNIIVTDNVKPYKERKVKILNGAHTCLVPIAYQMDLRLVSEMMNNSKCHKFLEDFMHDEVWGTIDLSKEELEDFTNSVFNRFLNPTIKHELLTISLNSMTKYKTRILPSAIATYENTKKLPEHALFSLACLFNMYSLKNEDGSLLIKDDPEFIEMWTQLDGKSADEIVDKVMSLKHWEYDFDQMEGSKQFVKDCLNSIKNKGVETTLDEVFG